MIKKFLLIALCLSASISKAAVQEGYESSSWTSVSTASDGIIPALKAIIKRSKECIQFIQEQNPKDDSIEEAEKIINLVDNIPPDRGGIRKYCSNVAFNFRT